MPVVATRRQVNGAASVEEEQRVDVRFGSQQLRAVRAARKRRFQELEGPRVIAEHD